MKLNKENQKGFTLVELIVVIVIIGILAAITVPALLGYIDKGDKAQDEVDARTAYLAAQTVVTEQRIKSMDEVGSDASDKITAANFATELDKLDGDFTYSTTKVTNVAADKNKYSIEITNGNVIVTYKGVTDGVITMGDSKPNITTP